MAGEADDFILLFLAFIFPPATAAFITGCSGDLCLNVLLTLLGYLPGLIHAFWLVMRRADANERYGHKNWTYAGMGHYAPIHPGSSVRPPYPTSYVPPPPVAPPPAPGENLAVMTSPPSQVPVDSKFSGYGYTLQAPIDQKSGSQAPPSAPLGQKYGEHQGPSQVPPEQRVVNVGLSAPADQKAAGSTAPPGGT